MTTGRINQVTIFTDDTETLIKLLHLIELICTAMFFVTFFKGRFLRTLSSKTMKKQMVCNQGWNTEKVLSSGSPLPYWHGSSL